MSTMLTCDHCGAGGRLQLHHVVYRCNGGGSQLVPLCDRCHKQLHSQRGDFREWGRRGGKATAARRHYVNNLKQFQNAHVRAVYLEKLESAHEA
jgi:hypothetical protein